MHESTPSGSGSFGMSIAVVEHIIDRSPLSQHDMIERARTVLNMCRVSRGATSFSQPSWVLCVGSRTSEHPIFLTRLRRCRIFRCSCRCWIKDIWGISSATTQCKKRQGGLIVCLCTTLLATNARGLPRIAHSHNVVQNTIRLPLQVRKVYEFIYVLHG